MERSIAKILILGATGRTGKWVVQKAIEKGYALNILVRNISKITNHTSLTIFEGNPQNKSDIEKAAKDCNAIISVLNISRITDFPWAKLRTPKTFLSDVMQHIVSVAKEQKIERVVVCSAWGVAETNLDVPFWFRWTIKYSNIGVAYADHERQEKALMIADLDWTIVRPVGLVNSKKIQEVRVSYNNSPAPKLTISRKAVAEFMIEALEDDSLIRKLPVISKQ